MLRPTHLNSLLSSTFLFPGIVSLEFQGGRLIQILPRICFRSHFQSQQEKTWNTEPLSNHLLFVSHLKSKYRWNWVSLKWQRFMTRLWERRRLFSPFFHFTCVLLWYDFFLRKSLHLIIKTVNHFSIVTLCPIRETPQRSHILKGSVKEQKMKTGKS